MVVLSCLVLLSLLVTLAVALALAIVLSAAIESGAQLARRAAGDLRRQRWRVARVALSVSRRALGAPRT